MHQLPWQHRAQSLPPSHQLRQLHNSAMWQQRAPMFLCPLSWVSSAGSRACLALSQQHLSSRPCKPLHRKHPKAAKHAMVATAMATAAVVSPAKVATRAQRVAVTDATTVAGAVDAVAVLTAKAAHSASVLTPKASQCLWMPTRRLVAKPNPVLMPIARNHAQSVLPANVASAVDAVVVAASATKTVSAMNPFAQRAVSSQ